jgi:hypothetical protein
MAMINVGVSVIYANTPNTQLYEIAYWSLTLTSTS